jgi:hypothetical protein
MVQNGVARSSGDSHQLNAHQFHMIHRRSRQTHRVSAPAQQEPAGTPGDRCACSQMQVEFSRLEPTYRRLALRLVGALLKTQRRER